MRLRFLLKNSPYTLLFIALFSAFIINLLPGEAAMKSRLSLLSQIGAGINLLAGKNRLLLLLPVMAGTVIEFFSMTTRRRHRLQNCCICTFSY
ncbi:hypothetical protein ACE6ZO_004113 [Salmonella enterica]